MRDERRASARLSSIVFAPILCTARGPPERIGRLADMLAVTSRGSNSDTHPPPVSFAICKKPIGLGIDNGRRRPPGRARLCRADAVHHLAPIVALRLAMPTDSAWLAKLLVTKGGGTSRGKYPRSIKSISSGTPEPVHGRSCHSMIKQLTTPSHLVSQGSAGQRPVCAQ
jgi:hypothetical protein